MATSLLCDDVECNVKWFDGIYGEEDWFACECLLGSSDRMDIKTAEEKATELGLTRRDFRCKKYSWDAATMAEEKKKEDEATTEDKDALLNIRVLTCGGMKCRIGYGHGVHIHCERCAGPILNALRGEARRLKESTSS
jgi:hypothetical protein